MGDIVALSDLKTALRVTGSGNDAELNQIISRIERRFQGEIGQNLIQTTYTSEKYTGEGTVYLYLKRYPLISLTSVAIENEGTITVSDVEQIRYRTGPESDGILEFVNGRTFSKRYPNNVTVTYAAGHTASAIVGDLPDVWELLTDTAAQLFLDMDTRRAKVASQSYMGGAVAYFDPITLGKGFMDSRWRPLVQKHMRRRRAAAQVEAAS